MPNPKWRECYPCDRIGLPPPCDGTIDLCSTRAALSKCCALGLHHPGNMCISYEDIIGANPKVLAKARLTEELLNNSICARLHFLEYGDQAIDEMRHHRAWLRRTGQPGPSGPGGHYWRLLHRRGGGRPSNVAH